MQKFNDWLEKRLLESDWQNPAAQQSLGGSSIMSGLEKITRGLRKGLYPDGYTDISVLANHFGLSEEELSAIWKLKILTKNGNGQGIDVQRLQTLQRQLNPGQSSQISPTGN